MLQNSFVRIKFFFDQNLDFVLGLHLEVLPVGKNTHPREVYASQRFTGAASTQGTETTIHVDGHDLFGITSAEVGLVLCDDIDPSCSSKTCADAVTHESSSTITALGADGRYTFSFAGPVVAGNYRACYCSSAGHVAPHDSKKRSGGTAFEPSDTNVNNLPTGVSRADVGLVTASELCEPTCTGSNCGNCDFYSPSDHSDITTLFLLSSAKAAWDTCKAISDNTDSTCQGFDWNPESHEAYFYTDVGTPTAEENWEYYAVTVVSACASADFSKDIGTAAITDRVSINQEWVLSPGLLQSIEVVGDSLDPNIDRIYLVDEKG